MSGRYAELLAVGSTRLRFGAKIALPITIVLASKCNDCNQLTSLPENTDCRAHDRWS
jgi:hypothetical protein